MATCPPLIFCKYMNNVTPIKKAALIFTRWQFIGQNANRIFQNGSQKTKTRNILRSSPREISKLGQKSELLILTRH